LARELCSKNGEEKKNAPYGAIKNLCILMLCAYGAVDRNIFVNKKAVISKVSNYGFYSIGSCSN